MLYNYHGKQTHRKTQIFHQPTSRRIYSFTIRDIIYFLPLAAFLPVIILSSIMSHNNPSTSAIVTLYFKILSETFYFIP